MKWKDTPYFLRISTAVMLILGFSLHLKAVWHQQLFGDEIHSLFFFRLPWWTLLSGPVEPVHPNGYYLILKGLYSLTPWVSALRWWQMGIFLVSAYLFWKVLGRLSVDGWSRWAGVALWGASAYVWHFSYQLRMYGLGMVLLLGSWWSLTEKKRWGLWVSVALDWLAVGVVYGASLFVVAKWVSWLLLVRTDRSRFRIGIVAATASLIPVAAVIWQTRIQQAVIDQGYLYWVHVPQASDWSLGLASFATGLFLPYFEGFSALGEKWLLLGTLLNVGGVIVLVMEGRWFFRHRKTIRLSESERFLLILTSVTLLLYSGLFFFGVVRGSHFFHIRQIFPVAVVGWLLAAWTISQIFRRLPVAAFVVWGGIVSLNLAAAWADNWGERQAYPHHFTQLAGVPTYVTSADVELIYKQCGVFSHEESLIACREKGVVVLNDSQQFKRPETAGWWLTHSAAAMVGQGLTNFRCHQETADYQKCTE